MRDIGLSKFFETRRTLVDAGWFFIVSSFCKVWLRITSAIKSSNWKISILAIGKKSRLYFILQKLIWKYTWQFKKTIFLFDVFGKIEFSFHGIFSIWGKICEIFTLCVPNSDFTSNQFCIKKQVDIFCWVISIF